MQIFFPNLLESVVFLLFVFVFQEGGKCTPDSSDVVADIPHLHTTSSLCTQFLQWTALSLKLQKELLSEAPHAIFSFAGNKSAADLNKKNHTIRWKHANKYNPNEAWECRRRLNNLNFKL